MNRFDIGVVVVTFVALGLIAIIRNIVAPLVRYRISRHRLPSHAIFPTPIPQEDRRQLDVEDASK